MKHTFKQFAPQRRALRSPIGLDVGPRTITAAQLAWTARQGRLEAVLQVHRPSGAGAMVERDEAAWLTQVLRRQGFTGRDVAVVVPDRRLITSMLELPPRASGAPLEQLARAEVSRAHRLEPGSFEMSCWEIPGPARAAEGSHMMAVACRHADADELVQGLESSGAGGLRIVAMDVRACAIARASRAAVQDCGNADGIVAVLDIAETAAQLVIARDGIPLYERHLAEGGLEPVRLRIHERLGVAPELADHLFDSLRVGAADLHDDVAREAAAVFSEHLEGLCRELRTATTYAEHRFSTELPQLFAQGAGAAIAGVTEHLASALGIPVKALCPADAVEVHPALPRGPSLMTVVGLAMHPGERGGDPCMQ